MSQKSDSSHLLIFLGHYFCILLNPTNGFILSGEIEDVSTTVDIMLYIYRFLYSQRTIEIVRGLSDWLKSYSPAST